MTLFGRHESALYPLDVVCITIHMYVKRTCSHPVSHLNIRFFGTAALMHPVTMLHLFVAVIPTAFDISAILVLSANNISR